MKIIQKEQRKESKTKNTKVQITSSARKSVSKVFNNLSSSSCFQRILVLLHWYVTDLTRICFWLAYRIGWGLGEQRNRNENHYFPLRTVRTKNHEKYGREFFFKIGY